MMPRIALVAVCCSSASAKCFCASASSRVRWSSCIRRLAAVEPRRAAIGALLRLAFVVLRCCVFARLRPVVARRLTETSHSPTVHTLPHHEFVCASQQNWLAIGSYGSFTYSCHPGVSGSPRERTFGQCPRL